MTPYLHVYTCTCIKYHYVGLHVLYEIIIICPCTGDVCSDWGRGVSFYSVNIQTLKMGPLAGSVCYSLRTCMCTYEHNIMCVLGNKNSGE